MTQLPRTIDAIHYSIPLADVDSAEPNSYTQRVIHLRTIEFSGYVAIEANESGTEWNEIATCELFRQSNGASFSGWVVRGRAGNYTDPIRTKRGALRNLAFVVEEDLNAHVVYGRHERRLVDLFDDERKPEARTNVGVAAALDMDALVREYESGDSTLVLAERHHVHPATIARRLGAVGAIRTIAEAARVRYGQARLRPGSLQGLADDLGMPAEQVAGLLTRHGFITASDMGEEQTVSNGEMSAEEYAAYQNGEAAGRGRAAAPSGTPDKPTPPQYAGRLAELWAVGYADGLTLAEDYE